MKVVAPQTADEATSAHHSLLHECPSVGDPARQSARTAALVGAATKKHETFAATESHPDEIWAQPLRPSGWEVRTSIYAVCMKVWVLIFREDFSDP